MIKTEAVVFPVWSVISVLEITTHLMKALKHSQNSAFLFNEANSSYGNKPGHIGLQHFRMHGPQWTASVNMSHAQGLSPVLYFFVAHPYLMRQEFGSCIFIARRCSPPSFVTKGLSSLYNFM